MLRQLGAYWFCNIAAGGCIYVALAFSDVEALEHLRRVGSSWGSWVEIEDYHARGPIALDRWGLQECPEHGQKCQIVPATGKLIPYCRGELFARSTACEGLVNRTLLTAWCQAGDHFVEVDRSRPSDATVLAALVGLRESGPF